MNKSKIKVNDLRDPKTFLNSKEALKAKSEADNDAGTDYKVVNHNFDNFRKWVDHNVQ